ncbi:DUF1365 domain-containing protein [Pedobacter boryungensis]|uniref:DUF1365 domain-containing protein n=1 Tax=Pedobacter boryungensis TaxID=869962 RepID=A0ABX2D953_9SPHI|nr:DUF1365 domain-containing protein [Pedobacter boryungensis]NQX30099.1 DUF1365 domain-containing protein [Pedobacter boryungensis]
MNFNSSIYAAKVMHHRLAPKKHSFWYNVFMFYIDLDELEILNQKLRWFNCNRFNLFNFRDKDHLQLPIQNPDRNKTVKQQITTYLKSHNVEIGKGKIMLLTNLSVLGYNFNPVSFYFCFDENNNPLCAVAEISNTYNEMKMFFFGKDQLEVDTFKQRTKKHFYVSPFIDLDDFFDFNLTIPSQKLNIKIDDYDKQGNRFFISTLIGEKKKLTNASMLRYFFSIPMIPLRVMGLIHWQAFKLWIKRIKYHPKAANQDLQKDVYKPYKTN